MKQKGLFLLKILLSFWLLGYLVAFTDMTAIKLVVCRANLLLVAVAFLVLVAGFFISCFKWQVLLKADGAVYSFLTLVRYYLIGVYFNNFLPTSIGGDAVRIFLVSKNSGKRIVGINSVLAERFSGLVAVIVLGLLGVCLAPAVAGDGGLPLFAGALGVSMLALVILANGRFRAQVKRIVPAVLWCRIEQVIDGTGKYFCSIPTLWMMTWTSLIFQTSIVLVYFLGAKALALTISFPNLMVVVPIVTLLMLIPISLNGLGIREGGFVVLLSRLGVAQAEALSLSLLIYALTLLFSLVGGLCFLQERK